MENKKPTKEELEMQKVQFEVKELKYKCSLMQRVISITAILFTVAGLSIGGCTLWLDYKDRQKEAIAQEQKRKDEATLTFGKSLLEKHLNVYLESVDAVSKIATIPPESQLRKDAEEKFRQLFNGSMILVEDAELNSSKVAISDCLDELERVCAESESGKKAQLEKLSQSFASNVKKSLATQWGIELKDTYKSRELPTTTVNTTELSKLEPQK
jgi:hypothetical protein